jgi:hypothetical protein
VDFNGNKWTSDPILPHFISGLDFNGYITEAQCRKLFTQNKFSGVNNSSIKIFYRGTFSIPANTLTKTKTWVGERLEKQGYNINVATFSINGMDFEMFADQSWLRVYVTGSSFPPDYNIAMRISETLQFVLGRTLSWSAIELCDNEIQTTTISSSKRNEKISKIDPPLAFGAVDTENDLWKLFEKYFSHIIDYKKNTWHPILKESIRY